MEAAAYHDAAEVSTGDLATPIKYFNPGIQEAYRTVEAMAEKKLMDMLPSELRPTFQSLFQDVYKRQQQYPAQVPPGEAVFLGTADHVGSQSGYIYHPRRNRGELCPAKGQTSPDAGFDGGRRCV